MNEKKIKEILNQKTIKIIVKPNSPKNEIIGYDENKEALKVAIRACPEDNKANIELIKFFTKLKGKRAKIISGLKNKNKLISFDD